MPQNSLSNNHFKAKSSKLLPSVAWKSVNMTFRLLNEKYAPQSKMEMQNGLTSNDISPAPPASLVKEEHSWNINSSLDKYYSNLLNVRCLLSFLLNTEQGYLFTVNVRLSHFPLGAQLFFYWALKSLIKKSGS